MIKFLCVCKIKIKNISRIKNYEWYLSNQGKKRLNDELASLQEAEIVNGGRMHHDIFGRIKLIRDKLHGILNNQFKFLLKNLPDV